MVQPQFDQLARIHGVVNWQEESSFALQILSENNYLAQVAMANQDSLKRAIINVAAIGLSLNPYKRQAYLIPRKGRICLEISYVGYIQQAIDIGAIKWSQAEIVCEHDTFKFMGMNHIPVHQFEPFGERGRKIGGYTVTELAGGGHMICHMNIDEIYALRDRSEAWKAYKRDGKSGPWNTDENEMIKKTLIRRARKSWPMENEARVTALEKADQDSDPILLTPAMEPTNVERQEMILKIRMALEILGRQESAYIKHLVKITGHDVKALEDLTTIELKQAVIALNQLVDQKTQKEQK